MKTLSITSLFLASAILSEIDECFLEGINHKNLVNGKKVIKLSYPEDKEEAAQKLMRDFDDKVLLVNLYHYQRNMRHLKDKLFETRRTGR